MSNTEYLWPYIFTNLPRSQNLLNKWHAKISGLTVYIHVWHFEVQEQQNICVLLLQHTFVLSSQIHDE